MKQKLHNTIVKSLVFIFNKLGYTVKVAEEVMAGGRPTKLTDELLEKARGYIEYRNEQGKLPTLEGLSVYLKIHRDTIYDWRDKSDEFSDIYREIMAEQGDQLITNGLNGSYNSTIAKLILTKHDYSDKQGIDHTTKGKEMPVPILGGTSVSSSNINEEATES